MKQNIVLKVTHYLFVKKRWPVTSYHHKYILNLHSSNQQGDFMNSLAATSNNLASALQNPNNHLESFWIILATIFASVYYFSIFMIIFI